MPKIKDGDRCPKNNKLVMIRSELGCLSCQYKDRLIANQYTLVVKCTYEKPRTSNDRT